mmetsp:Transcript_13860/g.21853  ORF Transcript_13860/g.21853 Transcript_13860/m.21853 type:complete len:126 (-) Transcript_13860:259-636(-)
MIEEVVIRIVVASEEVEEAMTAEEEEVDTIDLEVDSIVIEEVVAMIEAEVEAVDEETPMVIEIMIEAIPMEVAMVTEIIILVERAPVAGEAVNPEEMLGVAKATTMPGVPKIHKIRMMDGVTLNL